MIKKEDKTVKSIHDPKEASPNGQNRKAQVNRTEARP